MKKLILILILFNSLKITFGQVASNYFPLQTGYKWNYEFLPLDSLNNPIDSLKFYGLDSFFVSIPFNGKEAKIILTKKGSLNSINVQPYSDSLFCSFEGSNGLEYFDPLFLSDLLGVIDSTLGIDFNNFFSSLEGWYSYYQFASSLNQNYTVFSKDTTVIIDTTTLPLRFQLIGKRLDDETINTQIGTFNCKKFLLERRLSYLLFNVIPVKILGVEETIWLAPSNWKVKSYVPSTVVDLSVAGAPVFSIPGLETNVISSITSLNELHFQPALFELYQNYPNPFNPSTTIKFYLPASSYVSLKVYDILGNMVKELVNEFKSSGYHTINFSVTEGLSSGIYFYVLKTANQISTKKMILVK